MKISLCICTWNRAEFLRNTLGSLAAIAVPGDVSLEIIVVDNNSTDSTPAVLSEWKKCLGLQVLFEPKAGLSNARNCALEHATGDLIVWTDDDVQVDCQFITEYAKVARDYPEAAYFGGTISPNFEIPAAPWITANLSALQGPLVIRELGEETRPFAVEENPFGANMAFRRNAIKGRFFNVSLGNNAGNLVGGEETEFIDQLRRDGGFGIWVGAARVLHHVPAKRMTREFVAKWCADAGLGEARQFYGETMPMLMGVPRWTVRRYWEAQVQLWFSRMCGSNSWIRPFMQVQRSRAFLQEWRRLSQDSRQPTLERAIA